MTLDSNTDNKNNGSTDLTPVAQPLEPAYIPLYGRHLIEASAGTGKTFNITRLYIRLLLERELSVQQILIMTFTEAATEEIRGRVAEYIDEVIAQWDAPSDPIVASIQTRIDTARGAQLLQVARLEIDDASIFTIHGFCQRLLSQYASSFRYNTDAVIQVNTDRFYLQAITDALLVWRKDSDFFAQLEQASLHTPDTFYKTFYAVFNKNTRLCVVDLFDTAKELMHRVEHQWGSSQAQREELATFFHQHRQFFYAGLADKPENMQKIDAEIDEIIHWLNDNTPRADSDYLNDPNDFTELVSVALKSEKEASLNKLFINSKYALLTASRKKKYAPEFANKLSTACLSVDEIFLATYRINGKKITSGLAKVELYKVLAPFLTSIKDKVSTTLDKQGLISFDQMIYKVADALALKTQESTSLIDKIKHKYPVALVDEFQDTDSSQYAILKALYSGEYSNEYSGECSNTDYSDKAKDERSALYMIGDPKQAIYGFRGGDVFTYLAAKYDADYLWSMGTNWRSTSAMVDAYNALFFAKDSKSKFMFDIDYLPVLASDKAKAATVHLFDTQRKCIQDSAIHFGIANAKEIASSKEQEFPQYLSIVHWMVDEIIDLLNDYVFKDNNVSCDLAENGENNKQISTIEVQPKDIAILVRTGHEATIIRRELARAGLKSVYLSERTSLFQSLQAKQMYYVLDAINTLNDISKTRSALATGILLPAFQNIDINALIEDEEHVLWQEVFKQIAEYKRIWQWQGVFALLNQVIRENITPLHDAERALTNFTHLAEEIGSIAVIQQTPKAQLFWLQSQIQDSSNATSEIRLESDQALIKIITQHKSKGLEYPIVFVPFANASAPSINLDAIVYHDEHHTLKTQLGYSHEAYLQSINEDRAERMRLLYVAVTRAVYRCYLGMLCAKGSEDSALHRALNLREKLSNIDNISAYQQAIVSGIRNELADAGESIHVGLIASEGGRRFEPQSDSPTLSYNKVNIDIDDSWRITSFSGLLREYEMQTAVLLADTIQARLPMPVANIFERDNDAFSVTPEPELDSQSDTLRFTLTPGAEAGNMLHDLLELSDFSKADFNDTWRKLEHKYAWFDNTQFASLVAWLKECLQARLLADGLCLQDLPLQNTLRETNFYFPMNKVVMSALYNAVNKHRRVLFDRITFGKKRSTELQMPDEKIAPIHLLPCASDLWSEKVHVGMMQGFIDLIFEHNGKYYVVDYKSSYLGKHIDDYAVESLFTHIQAHQYDVQYHIYALALHRMLAQKIPDYEYEKYFGGVLYLYLRGMSSECPNNVSNGVFQVGADEIDIQALTSIFEEARHE
ncbi:exodeoxyribonuclease V subunit beta [Agaribacter marinus]|uniref:RecBCD enzyme subunit RecB n=1 Tax=Agaribacter marinus TaxID=1431249 RepID=A0AA37SWN6_9ALTE|nr:exodeoxyribonuclease V subunit beta [Agaribacter marinus]GLR69759.1 RecBCD enzyme subunit RecB [Agaribacter marinus]